MFTIQSRSDLIEKLKTCSDKAITNLETRLNITLNIGKLPI